MNSYPIGWRRMESRMKNWRSLHSLKIYYKLYTIKLKILVGLPYVMWSAHFFVTNIQTEKISSWNGPTVHVCCFMLARASNKTFVSRIHIRWPSPKKSEKSSLAEKFVSWVTHWPRYHCTLLCNKSTHQRWWGQLYQQHWLVLHISGTVPKSWRAEVWDLRWPWQH
jgi:hypothetical protein